MLISLPVAKLIKKMGVTVFCLLTAHLGIKNKNVPYLERELRRKGWLLHFRASQVCAHNTKLHVSRYSSFQKNMGLLNPVYSVAINSFPVPPSFPQINLIPRVSNADSVISSLSSSFPPRRLLVFRHTGRKRCSPRPRGLVAGLPYHQGCTASLSKLFLGISVSVWHALGLSAYQDQEFLFALLDNSWPKVW